jgi:hypothetical protein
VGLGTLNPGSGAASAYPWYSGAGRAALPFRRHRQAIVAKAGEQRTEYTMQMKPFFAAIAVTLGLTAGIARAADEAMLTEEKKAEITAMMVAEGYEVRSVQIEDGMYEVYAVKDGKMYEVYLNDALEMVSGGDEGDGD